MLLSDCSYAVVDCETTGLHPRAHHRIVELAIVPVDGNGGRGKTWSTLLNPERDLGPTDVHGITGRDLLDAPHFEDILGDVIEQLAGRVLVAHNARFDCKFIEAELGRAGIDVADLAALCTMRLASALGRASGSTRLVDCCAEFGIEVDGAHSAENDAVACADLFRAYLARLPARGFYDLASLDCNQPPPRTVWPRISATGVACRRATAMRVVSEPPFLAGLSQNARATLRVDTVDVAAYLDILDRALEDRHLSTIEHDQLAAVASDIGLGAEQVRAIHADYVGTLIALAYRDGVVTDRERADLDRVAGALGVADLDDAIARVAAARSSTHVAATSGCAGQTVCFTGALVCCRNGTPITREIAKELAEAAGMTVVERVTKKLDMLVVADPDSLSGKARKAREYGIRIVAETAFWPMIGVEVE